jgi:glutathione S-transferase
MKLLVLPTSPFCARILIQVREKGLDLPLEYPAEGRSVAEHAALNPFARIPILVVGETCLVESAAIQEYLEDVHPIPRLRPADPLDRARMRALVLAVDHYLFPALRALRGPGESVESAARIRTLYETLDRLQRLMGASGYACGDHLTLADCALAPAVFFVERFLAARDRPSALSRRERLAGWWKTVSGHDAVARVIEQLERAADEAGR